MQTVSLYVDLQNGIVDVTEKKFEKAFVWIWLHTHFLMECDILEWSDS